MKQKIVQRIESLRKQFDPLGIQAFIIPGTDPHLSEYVAPHWKTRQWASGFTGSAGTVVVMPESAGLWTDSRYFLQAAEQLAGTGIGLFKEMLPETPSISAYLGNQLRPGSTVGIDGTTYSVNQVEQLRKELEVYGLLLNTQIDPVAPAWTDRPPMPAGPARIYPIDYAGVSCEAKIAAIRTRLQESRTEGLFLSALDEIAWTLNLRGDDVHCNPVVVSFLLITQEESLFFIAPEKLTDEVRTYLAGQGIQVKAYTEIASCLAALRIPSLSVNPAKTCYTLFSAINPACEIRRGDSPVALLKAIRNEKEIEGVHRAMVKDGVALVKFLKWLEEAVPGGNVTELSADEKLTSLRAEQPLYMGNSFDTIAGYKDHGAIVHYSATPESNATLKPVGYFLLDSGAQYLDGTTDITRTIALGELSEEEKTDYTLVLKGHIALALAEFPAGTRGAQLDVLARLPMWKQKKNFLHGTGHGIGHFLNVHEGPQSIRMNENPTVLQPGMLTSNEPGAYVSGSHGVRTENLILTCKAGEGMFGEYLRFETVTLCPICTQGIRKEMLSEEEVEWLNNYHRKVFEKLSPAMDEAEKEWLKKATQSI